MSGKGLYVLALVGMMLSLPALAQYSSPVRDVENPDRSPFRATGIITLDAGGFGGILGHSLGNLPTGKRTILEYINVRCYTSPADSVEDVFIYVPFGGSWVPMPILMSKQGLGATGYQYWVGSAAVSIRTEPGSIPNLGAGLRRANNVAAAGCQFEVQGHTINLP